MRFYWYLCVHVCTIFKLSLLLYLLFVPNFVIDGAKLLKVLICMAQVLYQYMYKKKNDTSIKRTVANHLFFLTKNT